MKKLLNANGWHRRLEGWPLVFTVLTTLAILVGTVVEIAPLYLVDGAVEDTALVEPFTPLEVLGRDIYIAEGCVGCHSQMVRPFRHELERYGPAGQAGETVYERPFLWGSKRTGPDLSRVGGKYPHLWHVRHMENPRSTSPGSIMPPYDHMLTNEADFDVLPERVAALQALGVPYSEEEVGNAATLARAQAEAIAAEVVAQGGPERLEDKEIIAMVAYLQRLGVMSENDAQAEDDLEAHELEETLETAHDEQPGDLPGTTLEEEDLPPDVEPDDVDYDATDDGTVVDDVPSDDQ